MTNIEYATALRQIADFYEQHPDMDQPHQKLYVYTNTRSEFLTQAMELAKGGTIRKHADDADSSWPRYHAIRNFGGIEIDVSISRSQVCRLVSPAVYDCPDSLLEEAAEYTEPAA